MKKPVVFGLLILLIGFILWRMVDKELLNPSEGLSVQVDKENFEWFTCSSCRELFMAEATTRKGYCPYCDFQMMLVSETKRVFGNNADESGFIWFLSPNCGKLFLAYETGETGVCPYCNEAIALNVPPSIDLEESPTMLAAWTRAHAKGLLAGALGVFAFSMAGIFLLRERQIMLSLMPVDEADSHGRKIELSRHQARKKKLTLAGNGEADVVLESPSPNDIHFILSFVRVGKKTHSYLRHGSNKAVEINEKLEYNPRLKDHDKVTLGDIVYEVYTRED